MLSAGIDVLLVVVAHHETFKHVTGRHRRRDFEAGCELFDVPAREDRAERRSLVHRGSDRAFRTCPIPGLQTRLFVVVILVVIVVRSRHRVVHVGAGGEPAALVVDAVFEDSLPDALHQAAPVSL